MAKPNFFILGAPKCGTSSLAFWLYRHPEVYIAPMKEPNYYNTDLAGQRVSTPEAYARLFDGATERHRAIGEASAWYLYSQSAVPNILDEIPDARFIVCLRNPVEMARSLHGQQIFSSNEHIERFEDAWEAQPARAEGRDVLPTCSDPKLLLYGPACRLGSQLERLYENCRKDRVHCVFLDDMRADSRAIYLGALDFLDVEDDGQTAFPTVNSAHRRRSKGLARTIKRVGLLKQRLSLPRLGIARKIEKFNRTKNTRQPMSSATRAMLVDYFRDDIALLQKLTERDLGQWMQVDRGV